MGPRLRGDDETWVKFEFGKGPAGGRRTAQVASSLADARFPTPRLSAIRRTWPAVSPYFHGFPARAGGAGGPSGCSPWTLSIASTLPPPCLAQPHCWPPPPSPATASACFRAGGHSATR